MAATASGGGQAVGKQLKNCGFKRTVDVLVLYLAGQPDQGTDLLRELYETASDVGQMRRRNHGSEFGNWRNKEPFENPEDAVLLRAMARSVMEFSYVDWNNVATSQERQLENKAAAEVCKKLTVQFR